MNPYNPFEIEPEPTHVPIPSVNNSNHQMQVSICFLAALLIVCVTAGSIAFRVVDGNVRMAEAKYRQASAMNFVPTSAPVTSQPVRLYPISASATTQNLCVGAQLDVPDTLIGYNTHASGIITDISDDRMMVQTINKGGQKNWHSTQALGIYPSGRGGSVSENQVPVISGWCR